LAGYWSFDGRPVQDFCSRILDGQSRYGSRRSFSADGPIALGRNLFPLLPEDSYDETPLSRGPYQFVADVRLDNRSDIISQLGLAQSEAERMADSTLLFESLLKWGPAATDRFVGEFAFALWDGSKHELLLGRDILGLRPLHFHRGEDFFAFASMPSGLHAVEHIPYDVDLEFLAEEVALIPRSGRGTHFKGIERVEPGHLATISRGKFASDTYWHPKGGGYSRLSDAEYEEGLRAVLDQAVSAQLRGAAGVVASQLSGGLDSSIVTASVARQFPGKVMAYTAAPRAGFDRPGPAGSLADESQLAATTASLYPNVEHVILRNSGESPTEWFDRSFVYAQKPMPTPANAVWGQAILRAARDAGCNLIFKGGYGNLTLSYSGIEWLPYLLSKGRILSVTKHAIQLVKNGSAVIPLAAHIIGPFTPPPVWRAIRKLVRRNAGMEGLSASSRQHAGRLRRLSVERKWDWALRPQRDPMELRINEYRTTDGGNAYKGVLAEWGLSIRDPMTDRRLIEFSLSVPYDQFLRGGVSRSLARRAFRDRIPPEVANSSQRGYQSADWYEALDRARPQIEGEMAAIMRCEEASEALDFEWLQECVDNWPSEGWERDDIRRKYRLGLLRGMSAGHFIRKVKGTN
jgi:asparagine synthase (glutamine-hydrolysing)